MLRPGLAGGGRGARSGGRPGARPPDPGRGRTPPPPGREHAPPGRAGPVTKSHRVLRPLAELTFRFIAEKARELPVAWMCDALEVSESGYHAWTARAPSEGEHRLVAAIGVIHAEVKGRYGSPRMTAELNARGHACSEITVANLMRCTASARRHPAGSSARPTPGTACRWPTTSSTGTSPRPGRMPPDRPTSRPCRRPTGGSTRPWSRTCSAG